MSLYTKATPKRYLFSTEAENGTFFVCFRMGRIVSACGDLFSACGDRCSACGETFSHAEIRVPRRFRMWRPLFRVWRTRSLHAEKFRMRRGSSARGTPVSAYGDGPPHVEHEFPHAENESPHAEIILHMHVVPKTMTKVPFSTSCY